MHFTVSDMPHIKRRFVTAIQLLFLLLFALCILRAPARACSYAALALSLWFEKMIPALFPFMALSGLIVRLDFGKLLSIPVYPFLGRLYKINKTMCTALFIGFFFGFPLGAKTVAEEYSLGHLSKQQAQYLLSFCNNIGPVYLLGFALPLLGIGLDSENAVLGRAATVFFFMIPLLYGLLLRFTLYRRMEATPFHRKNAAEKISFLSALDCSITSACAAITRLGGYMIFFLVCNLLVEQTAAILKGNTSKILAFPAPLLEITSGLALSKEMLSPALSMTFLTFGGLSCFAQTYTCIRDTDLSFQNYCLHKFLQSIIAFFLYALLFSAFLNKPFLLS